MFIHFLFLILSFLLGQESCVGLLASAVVILFTSEYNLSQVIASFSFICLLDFFFFFFIIIIICQACLAMYRTINIMIQFSTY
jgi:hypothetical protein